MPRPRLSVCSLTVDSAGTLPIWAEAVREYADEIVIAVDESSSDGTEEVARAIADQVFVVEHPGAVERVTLSLIHI